MEFIIYKIMGRKERILIALLVTVICFAQSHLAFIDQGTFIQLGRYERVSTENFFSLEKKGNFQPVFNEANRFRPEDRLDRIEKSQGRKPWEYIDQRIGNWIVDRGQLGFGPNYNSRWDKDTLVLELDSDKNQIYKYLFNLNSGVYQLSFRWAARQGFPLETSQFAINFNGINIANINPNTFNIQNYVQNLKAVNGQNILMIIGKGSSDAFGASVAFFSLERRGDLPSPPSAQPPVTTTPPVMTPPVTATPPVTTTPPIMTPPVTTTPPIMTPPVTTTPPIMTPPVTTTPPIMTPPVTTTPPVMTPPVTTTPPVMTPPVTTTPPVMTPPSPPSPPVVINDVNRFRPEDRLDKIENRQGRIDWQQVPGKIGNWQVNLGQFGFGSTYNSRWNRNLVLVELDSNANQVYKYRFNLEAGLYELSFQWAAREGFPLQTSQLAVNFNGVEIRFLNPPNYDIQFFRSHVNAVSGVNVLELIAKGPSDNFGASVGYFSLERRGDLPSPPPPPPPPPVMPTPPVVNDANRFRPEDRLDRIENRQGRRDWQQVPGKIGNWQVNLGQFGFGSTYNSRWNRNLVLVELDSNANQVYKYRFNLEAGLYELSFQWAAREGFPLQTSQLAVNFNGVEIRFLNPPNYDIQFFRSHVNAVSGVNVLELIAKGPSDNFGASVGYFSLERRGDLPSPPPPPPPSPPVVNDANRFRPEDRLDRIENRQGRRDWQQVPGRIGNWQVNLGQFGFGSTYNSRWNRNLVLVELDSNANQVYKYRFNLEAGLYELSFQWAAREGFPLQTSQLAVNFNGVEIRFLNPPNYDIQFFRSHVNAVSGVNVLELIAKGPSDNFGASVGYFSLERRGDLPSPPPPPPPPPVMPTPPVVNDANRFRPEDRLDRIENRQGRRDWQQVPGKIGNWQVNLGQFGFGSTYNSRWNRNLVLVELDSNANQVYKYRFNLEAGLYELSFQWAAREGFPLQTSQLAVNFNGVEIRFLNPPNYDIQFFRSHVNAVSGVNVLELIAKGPSDNFGASVGYFSLERRGDLPSPPPPPPPPPSPPVVNDANRFRPEDRLDRIENRQGRKDWQYAAGRIGNWQVNLGQLGFGSTYNSRWNRNLVLVELDSNANQVYKYRFNLEAGLYELSFQWAAREGFPLQTSQLSVKFNSLAICYLNPPNYEIQFFRSHVNAVNGVNVLQLIGRGPSDHFGSSVGYFSLIKT